MPSKSGIIKNKQHRPSGHRKLTGSNMPWAHGHHRIQAFPLSEHAPISFHFSDRLHPGRRSNQTKAGNEKYKNQDPRTKFQTKPVNPLTFWL